MYICKGKGSKQGEGKKAWKKVFQIGNCTSSVVLLFVQCLPIYLVLCLVLFLYNIWIKSRYIYLKFEVD